MNDSTKSEEWKRFEAAVDAAAKAGPMHKIATKPKRKKTSSKKPAA